VVTSVAVTRMHYSSGSGVQKQKPDFPFPWVAAYVHCELGERDAALAWLGTCSFAAAGRCFSQSRDSAHRADVGSLAIRSEI
jgi:hypothetical protein